MLLVCNRVNYLFTVPEAMLLKFGRPRNEKTTVRWLFKKSGADTENRTRDLTLTKGALYQLSHISTQN